MRANHIEHRFHDVSRQRGMLLIEALIAILIFSFGVLGLIGLQTTAVSQSSDAKLRSAAAELADKYINQIWVSDRTAATAATGLQTKFASTTGTTYKTWLGNATTPGTVIGTLPGVTSTANAPSVIFTPLAPGCATATPMTCTSPVTITMQWKSPHDGVLHNYVVSADVSLY